MSSDHDAKFAGNTMFWILLGPLAVTFMLAMRFLLSPLAVALFALAHGLVIFLAINAIGPDAVGAMIAFFFALWVYSYFLLGGFDMVMGIFQSVEDGVLIWAIKNLGIFGQIYYFIQRFLITLLFLPLNIYQLATDHTTTNAALAWLSVLFLVQAIILWVYHTRHHLGIFLDFWGRPRPELLEIDGDPDAALDQLRERKNAEQ
ncbi:MAG: hypothetical protein JJU15_08275 [Pararhodobacter sp.]|nr:hypothetical protein [Pararhodobacter sp.]